MNITRRDALLGATAAAVVTGAATAPLAMKAAHTKAALVNADPEIEALLGQLRAAEAHHDDLNAARCAAWERIPQNIKEALDAYPSRLEAPQTVIDTYHRHYDACGAGALDVQSDAVSDRINSIKAQIFQAPAMTLRGTLSKAHIAWQITAIDVDVDETDPDFDGQCGGLDDPVMIWSIYRDLERLAGEG